MEATVFISIIAQEQNGDWIDVLLQAGIIGTFVVFAIAMVFIKPGMSKRSKDDGDDGRR